MNQQAGCISARFTLHYYTMPEHPPPQNAPLLTTTKAAEYLGISRQVVAEAAKQGEIGTKHDAPGTRRGWIYMFTREELDRWFARERKAPGRPPKSADLIPSPVIRLAA